jgi:O-acetyl-ADP-ribose deacetylase (regulator of RNase III)
VHRIKIHQGKVATLNVDIIVSCYSQSAAVEMLAMASGDGLIPLRVGDVQIVANMNKDLRKETDKIFIEAIGPRWRGGDYQEELHLASCYSKAMDLAKQYNVRSIAFTPISCGPLGFPANRAIKVAVQQIKLGLQRNPLIESVVFCCFDPVTTALYRSRLGK